jgi:hypothetical protein
MADLFCEGKRLKVGRLKVGRLKVGRLKVAEDRRSGESARGTAFTESRRL